MNLINEEAARQGYDLLEGFGQTAMIQQLAQPDDPATQGVPRPRVLIVDDTPENIRLLMSFLGKSCQLLAATNGLKALEFAQADPGPDLILLDVMMPGLSGYEVCLKLKECEKTARIPVIFVTGLNDVDDEKRGLAMGAVDYISKPFHADLVRARVSNHLELKRHRDHLAEEVKLRTEQLLAAQRVQERLQSELEIASRLQKSMLPPAQLSHKQALGFGLAAHLRAARSVGGDLFDYFFLDAQRFLFLVGDVSDKGVPAALFMVQVRTLLRSLGPKTQTPNELLTLLNEELCRDNQACMFVTMLCGLFNGVTGELHLARGGHEHPLLATRDGRCRYIEFEGGPALGLWEDARFPDFSLSLGAGEVLSLYTDGVTEATNEVGEHYGEERLVEVLHRSASQTPNEIVQSLKASVEDFVLEAEPSDDITLLVLKRHE